PGRGGHRGNRRTAADRRLARDVRMQQRRLPCGRRSRHLHRQGRALHHRTAPRTATRVLPRRIHGAARVARYIARSKAMKSGLTPRMLNHAAYVTHDVAATADFYTRILGMELASTIFDDHVPSTGDDFPYFHIFFRMADGSTIAFFELADLPPRAQPSHPAYEVFDHMALQVKDRAELARWREWMAQNGVEGLGSIVHQGMIDII